MDGNGLMLCLRPGQSGLHPLITHRDHREHDFVGWQIAIPEQGKIIDETPGSVRYPEIL
jgi:hypothetical protein